jgi:hypothetical protein
VFGFFKILQSALIPELISRKFSKGPSVGEKTQTDLSKADWCVVFESKEN